MHPATRQEAFCARFPYKQTGLSAWHGPRVVAEDVQSRWTLQRFRLGRTGRLRLYSPPPQALGRSRRPSARQRVRVHGDPLDPALLLGPALAIHLQRLHLGQRGHAVVPDELAKDRIQPVEVRRLVEDDEELRTVGAGPLVRHGDDPPLRVPQRRADLVFEGAAPDGPAALRVLGRRRVRGRAGLDHEGRDEAVEGRSVVVMRGAEGEEVLDRGKGVQSVKVCNQRTGWDLSVYPQLEGSKKVTYLCGLGDALAKDLDFDVS